MLSTAYLSFIGAACKKAYNAVQMIKALAQYAVCGESSRVRQSVEQLSYLRTWKRISTNNLIIRGMENFELDPKNNRRYSAKRTLCSRCFIGCCLCLAIIFVVIIGGGYAVS